MFSSALKSFSSNITGNYQIGASPTASSGPWKIFDGKKRNGSSQVSIFVFERKSLEPSSSGFGARASATSVRKAQDEVVERLKKEASSLARLRHPSILQLVEPVEETRNGGLMFATEPVTASLAGILAEKDDQERAGGVAGRPSRFVVENPDGTRKRQDLEMDELEIQKGLLQVAKGLEFLHESAGFVHGNLTPEAIYVNSKSDWKISGLAFAGPPESSTAPQQSLPPISLSEVLYSDPRLPRSVQLNLDYTSPDFVLDANVNTSADMFSLGLIIVALYNYPHVSPFETHGNQSTYKKLLSSSSTVPTQGNGFLSSRPIPKDLSAVLPRLIARRPANRMTAREFQESQYFDNILVSTIRFLDDLPAKTPNEKAQFMRGLGRVMPQFPSSVLERKVLVALLEEMKDRELLSLILQNVFKIIKAIPSRQRIFPEKVLPRLKEIFLAKSNTQERDTGKEAGLVILLENMSLMVDSCSGKDFKEDILPIYHLAIESPTHSLVDAALKCLPTVLPVLDFSTVKHDLFPVIAAVFSKTSSLAIKTRGLDALNVLCGGSMDDMSSDDGLAGIIRDERPAKTANATCLDKFTVQEKVVPLLKAIKTKEPAVMIAALRVFQQVYKLADSEFLALEVLPILWSFSLGPLLNLAQFEAFMKLIKATSSKVETEQTRKLRELSRTSSPAPMQGRETGMSGSGMINGFARNSGSAGAEDDFERLVLGKKRQENHAFENEWGTNANSTAQPPAQGGTPFSWSSASATAAPKSSGVTGSSILQPMRPTSRSITPDQNLSSYPSLAPTSQVSPPLSSAFPPMQSPSSPWVAQTPSNTPATAQRTVSNPSLATLASLRGNIPNSSASGTQIPGVSSNFTIPPPPPSGNYAQTPTISSNLNRLFPQTVSPPPNPPPVRPQYGGGLGGTTPLDSTGAQPDTQKHGLDKYESLL